MLVVEEAVLVEGRGKHNRILLLIEVLVVLVVEGLVEQVILHLNIMAQAELLTLVAEVVDLLLIVVDLAVRA